MALFSSTLEGCNLADLGFRGSKYTWNNGRDAAHFTKERLDRAIANLEWCSLFHAVDVSVLAARTSDHKPLLVKFSSALGRRVQHRSFKFEAKWNTDAACGDLIHSVWGEPELSTNSMQSAQLKLQRCQQALKAWSSSKYGHASSVLKAKTQRLTFLQ
ncbi:hypothetical protein SLA2020_377400 [Shorea laevis]